MKNNIKLCIVVMLACLMTACGDNSRSNKKDRSVGGTSEILVVTQNIDQWNGRIGDSLRHFFLDYQYGLPQPESRNDLAHITLSGFSDMFLKSGEQFVYTCFRHQECDADRKRPRLPGQEENARRLRRTRHGSMENSFAGS